MITFPTGPLKLGLPQSNPGSGGIGLGLSGYGTNLWLNAQMGVNQSR